jgi:hypothetical protein
MRKYVLAAVAALCAALAIAGVASAIQGTQGLKVTATNKKAGTKEKPKSMGKFVVTTITTPVAGEPPFATSLAVISFDKNIVFGGSKFKECKDTTGTTIDTTCKAAKVGSGSSTGVALGQTENLTVTAYNGPKGNSIYLHVRGTAPLDINSVIVGTLKNATGAYGKKLNVPIPANLQQPLAGVFATLTSFSTSVGGTAKNTPFIGLKGCPKDKKLKFKGVFTYTDGTTKTAQATPLACSAAKK